MCYTALLLSTIFMNYLDYYLTKKDFIGAKDYLASNQAKEFEFQITSYPTKANALIYATVLGQSEIVKLILDKYLTQEQIQFKNDFGLNAFLAACMHNQKDIAQMLLDYGFNLEEKDLFNRKALEISVYFAANDVLRYLLNLNHIDKSHYSETHLGASGLIYKAALNNHLETLDILLRDDYFLNLVPKVALKLEKNLHEKEGLYLRAKAEKMKLDANIEEVKPRKNKDKL